MSQADTSRSGNLSKLALPFQRLVERARSLGIDRQADSRLDVTDDDAVIRQLMQRMRLLQQPGKSRCRDRQDSRFSRRGRAR